MASASTEMVHRFIGAMNTSDMATVAASFDPNVQAYITDERGETVHVSGREEMLAHFPDFAGMADSFMASVTQVHEIESHTVLFMVEIRAQRLGMTLHNFAGILIQLSDSGRIREYRMVEALPAESNHFWAAQS